VTLGIRPEHLVPAAQGPLHLHVILVETLGADTLAHGTLGPAGPACAVRLPGSATPAAGEVLPLAPAPGALHLFDPESGKRID
jgi:sn-glycerol 3-phosphate transport system ATP-binding protein